jgi:hypothetical protein
MVGCRRQTTKDQEDTGGDVSKNKIVDGMKVCKRGHRYLIDGKKCPECYRIKTIASRERTKKNDGKDLKTCAKGHQYPNNLIKCPECKKEYDASPNRKQYRKKRNQLPEVKAKRRKYEKTPKRKAYLKAYNQTPKHKNYKTIYNRKYRKTTAYKAYIDKPEVRRAKTVREGRRRTAKAIKGDLTNKQWDNRIKEFNCKCAYCHITLLTKEDDVEKWNPQYQNMDHIIPLIKNKKPLGEHTKNNVVPACYDCNHSKGNKDVWKWMKENNIKPSKKLLNILKELFTQG